MIPSCGSPRYNALLPAKRHSDDHQLRVNRVLDYISRHLDGELSLARLAQIGCFSPFHFHRIFQAVCGETLNNHVRRVRLERAAQLMRAAPRRRITEIALETGFPGGAEFSRSFKNHFGRTASSWDRRSPLEKSKICKAPQEHPFYALEELTRWKNEQQMSVRVSRLHAFLYAYIRVFAPYGNSRLVDAYHALLAWLANRGTETREAVFIGMSLDDPSLTPPEKCRYDMGVAFPREPRNRGMLEDIIRGRGRSRATALPTQAECSRGGLSLREFEPQEMASMHCVGDLGNVDRAWHYLYRVWLPGAKFEPADLPAMELFVRLPEEIGWTTFDLQACLPVVRR